MEQPPVDSDFLNTSFYDIQPVTYSETMPLPYTYWNVYILSHRLHKYINYCLKLIYFLPRYWAPNRRGNLAGV